MGRSKCVRFYLVKKREDFLWTLSNVILGVCPLPLLIRVSVFCFFDNFNHTHGVSLITKSSTLIYFKNPHLLLKSMNYPLPKRKFSKEFLTWWGHLLSHLVSNTLEQRIVILKNRYFVGRAIPFILYAFGSKFL